MLSTRLYVSFVCSFVYLFVNPLTLDSKLYFVYSEIALARYMDKHADLCDRWQGPIDTTTRVFAKCWAQPTRHWLWLIYAGTSNTLVNRYQLIDLCDHINWVLVPRIHFWSVISLLHWSSLVSNMASSLFALLSDQSHSWSPLPFHNC